jgi:hypothetical protein
MVTVDLAIGLILLDESLRTHPIFPVARLVVEVLVFTLPGEGFVGWDDYLIATV